MNSVEYLLIVQAAGGRRRPARKFIHWMVANVPNVDLDAGNVVLPYIPRWVKLSSRAYYHKHFLKVFSFLNFRT